MRQPGDAIGNIVFLSYRRADTAPHTLALKLELKTHFGAVQPFMDTSSIEIGTEWSGRIEDALRAANVVILMIGSNWAGVQEGARRIDDPENWVRKEVACSLEYKRESVIPILIDRARMPAPDELPEPLRALPSIQAMSIEVSKWDLSINHLFRVLEERFGFRQKTKTFKLPKPDAIKKEAQPVRWERLQKILAEDLRSWRVEFTEDPRFLHHISVELARDFEFRSFKEAMRFVQAVADHAEDIQHHPRWMNVWQTVTVWLTTWDAGQRISDLDLQFARYLERKFKAGAFKAS